MPPNNSYQTVYWVDCQRQMYAKLSRIGKALSTHAQEFQYEMQLREQAEQILKAKKNRHWRVGVFTKSERWVGYDENQQHIVREIMTKQATNKYIKIAHIPHLKARKNKKIDIQQELEAYDDE